MTVLTGKRVSNKKIAVKGHCLLSGHVSSFDDFTVLNYESHKFKRLIKDFLLVTKDKPLLNKKVSGDSNVNFSHAICHNNACGWGSITNDVVKLRKVIEFEVHVL